MKQILLYLILMLSFGIAKAQDQPGDLDITFGENGKQIVWDGYTMYDFAITADHKIVAVGIPSDFLSTVMVVFQFLENGSPDTGFGDNGKVAVTGVETDGAFMDIAVRSDGSIVASSGYYHLICLHPDGSINNDFGIDGIVDVSQNFSFFTDAMTTLPDGKILVSSYDFAGSNSALHPSLIRFNSNGAIDEDFGDDGTATFDFYEPGFNYFIKDMELQPNGNVLMICNMEESTGDTVRKIAWASFTSDGALIAEGHTDSYSFINAADIALSNDGKVYIAANGASQYYIFGFQNSNWLPIPGFGDNGKVQQAMDDYYYGFLPQLAVQDNGKILIAGTAASDIFVHCYQNNGNMDHSFGNNGKVTTDFGGTNGDDIAAAAIVNGKLLIGGHPDNFANMFMARYILDNTSGVNSLPFDNNAIAIYPNPFSNQLTISYTLSRTAAVQITLSDITGRQIQSLPQAPQQAGNHQVILALPLSIPAGLYFVNLWSPGGGYSRKVIKE